MKPFYYFDFYIDRCILNQDLWTDIFQQFFEANTCIDYDTEIAFFTENEKKIQFRGNQDVDNLLNWIVGNPHTNSFGIWFNELKNRSHYHFWVNPNYEKINVCQYGLSLYNVWDVTSKSTTQRKNEVFHSVKNIIENLSNLLQPFYGHAYFDQIEENYIPEYILSGKAKFPFNMTFWGNNYPSRPTSNAQETLVREGFIINNTRQGTWFYFPLQLWGSPESYSKMIDKAFVILGIDEIEKTYL